MQPGSPGRETTICLGALFRTCPLCDTDTHPEPGFPILPVRSGIDPQRR